MAKKGFHAVSLQIPNETYLHYVRKANALKEQALLSGEETDLRTLSPGSLIVADIEANVPVA